MICICVVCRASLPNLEEDGFHPNGGTAFHTSGHYGSGVFDPMDGTYLEIAICDNCLRTAGADGVVVMGFPQPAPPRGPIVKWPRQSVDAEANQ